MIHKKLYKLKNIYQNLKFKYNLINDYGIVLMIPITGLMYSPTFNLS